MAYALGIDVGTTFTAAATWEAGRATVVPLAQRSDAVPTVLYRADAGHWVIGEAADRHSLTEPGRVARGFKRRLGDGVALRLGDRDVTPVELTAEMLRWVADLAEQRQGRAPDDVQITVPADWGPFRIGLMLEAAEAARLGNVELSAEPVAAAVYYGAHGCTPLGATVGVFDFGGGTFDASLVARGAAGYAIRGRPVGDDSIGGMDLDDEVLGHVQRALAEDWANLDPDAPASLAGLSALRAEVVKAKEALSEDVETSVAVMLPGTFRTVRLTRHDLESMATAYVDRALDTFIAMLQREDVRPADLHAVLLVGGTSRIPLVSERLAQRLGRPVVLDAHPKYAVCLGAAMLAGARLDPPAALAARADLSPDLSPVAPVRQPASRTDRSPGATAEPAPARRTPTPRPPRERPSRVWIAADLAQAGLTAQRDAARTAIEPRAWRSSTDADDALVIRTQGRAISARALLVLAALVVVGFVTWGVLSLW